MQNAVRFIITLLFIGLIVIGVVFFSIIAVVPKDKLTKLKNKDFSPTQTTEKKSLFDFSFFTPIKTLITGNDVQENIIGVLPTPVEKTEELYPTNVPRPQASRPLSVQEIPSGVEKIVINENGFSPNTFRVKEGTQIVLVVENQGKLFHSFSFRDGLFAPVNMGLDSLESRGIQFYAVRKGEFIFRCDLPGHEDAGEVGMMIVE